MLMVFLGADLSFGAARLESRATFDYDRYDRWRPHGFPFADLMPDDDGLPVPFWPWLLSVPVVYQEMVVQCPLLRDTHHRAFFH